jgi:uroporphyrinogen decarboxylase
MGFKTGTLVAPDALRTHVLPWHKRLAGMAHSEGMVYLLHSCGHLDQIAGDLIEDVKIDGRHSYEDESNSAESFRENYGTRTAILGGIDVDKLARLSEADLRSHVRRIIGACLPGGRFAVGSGNTVCNYVPMANYFAMVEEAMNFGG